MAALAGCAVRRRGGRKTNNNNAGSSSSVSDERWVVLSKDHFHQIFNQTLAEMTTTSSPGGSPRPAGQSPPRPPLPQSPPRVVEEEAALPTGGRLTPAATITPPGPADSDPGVGLSSSPGVGLTANSSPGVGLPANSSPGVGLNLVLRERRSPQHTVLPDAARGGDSPHSSELARSRPLVCAALFGGREQPGVATLTCNMRQPGVGDWAPHTPVFPSPPPAHAHHPRVTTPGPTRGQEDRRAITGVNTPPRRQQGRDGVTTPPQHSRVTTPPPYDRVTTPPSSYRVTTPPSYDRVTTPVTTPPSQDRVKTPPLHRRVTTPGPAPTYQDQSRAHPATTKLTQEDHHPAPGGPCNNPGAGSSKAAGSPGRKPGQGKKPSTSSSQSNKQVTTRPAQADDSPTTTAAAAADDITQPAMRAVADDITQPAVRAVVAAEVSGYSRPAVGRAGGVRPRRQAGRDSPPPAADIEAAAGTNRTTTRVQDNRAAQRGAVTGRITHTQDTAVDTDIGLDPGVDKDTGVDTGLDIDPGVNIGLDTGLDIDPDQSGVESSAHGPGVSSSKRSRVGKKKMKSRAALLKASRAPGRENWMPMNKAALVQLVDVLVGPGLAGASSGDEGEDEEEVPRPATRPAQDPEYSRRRRGGRPGPIKDYTSQTVAASPLRPQLKPGGTGGQSLTRKGSQQPGSTQPQVLVDKQCWMALNKAVVLDLVEVAMSGGGGEQAPGGATTCDQPGACSENSTDSMCSVHGPHDPPPTSSKARISRKRPPPPQDPDDRFPALPSSRAGKRSRRIDRVLSYKPEIRLLAPERPASAPVKASPALGGNSAVERRAPSPHSREYEFYRRVHASECERLMAYAKRCARSRPDPAPAQTSRHSDTSSSSSSSSSQDAPRGTSPPGGLGWVAISKANIHSIMDTVLSSSGGGDSPRHSPRHPGPQHDSPPHLIRQPSPTPASTPRSAPHRPWLTDPPPASHPRPAAMEGSPLSASSSSQASSPPPDLHDATSAATAFKWKSRVLLRHCQASPEHGNSDDDVTSRKTPDRDVTSRKTPDHDVTSRKTPDHDVTSRKTPDHDVTSRKTPDHDVTSRKTPGDDVSSRKTPSPPEVTSHASRADVKKSRKKRKNNKSKQ